MWPLKRIYRHLRLDEDARATLHPDDLKQALYDHARQFAPDLPYLAVGETIEAESLDAEDRHYNSESLSQGAGPVYTAYRDRNGDRFSVETDVATGKTFVQMAPDLYESAEVMLQGERERQQQAKAERAPTEETQGKPRHYLVAIWDEATLPYKGQYVTCQQQGRGPKAVPLRPPEAVRDKPELVNTVPRYVGLEPTNKQGVYRVLGYSRHKVVTEIRIEKLERQAQAERPTHRPKLGGGLHL